MFSLRNVPDAQVIQACDDYQLISDANGIGYVILADDHDVILAIGMLEDAAQYYNDITS